MPDRPSSDYFSLYRTPLFGLIAAVVSLFCLAASAQEPAKETAPPVTISLGQKISFLPLLPETQPRAEYPLTLRAEADEHGLYVIFDLEDVVLGEMSRNGSPFYIDLHLDLRNEAERGSETRATRFRVVGRFDEGQMAVERTVGDSEGENLKTESQLDADARLSVLPSGTPRVSLFMGREEIGDHSWKIGEAGELLPFDVFVHFADFDRSETLELLDEDEEAEEGSKRDELSTEKGEPGQQVYPDWHKFVMVRGLNDPAAHTIPTKSMNSLLLHKFSLDDLPESLRAIGQANANDDIVRRANSVALMTILDAEVRGGLSMAREHKDESVREGAKRVTEVQPLVDLSGEETVPDNGSDTAGQ